jgi:hypothetical protein
MLSGDPLRFAIWCDQVDSWSPDFQPNLQNGCFGYFIGGEYIWSMRSTLGVDIYYLSQCYCMKYSVEDEQIFNLPIRDAYKELCVITYPTIESGADNDFRHLVSATSLSDDGYNIFLVEHKSQAKLIYGVDGGFDNAKEVILERGEFQRVVREVISKFNISFSCNN